MIGRIIVIVGVVLAVLVGALMIVPQLIPSGVYRDRIQAELTKALGRPVTMAGDIHVSVFPRIEARAGATAIANPPEFGTAPFASMKELHAAVSLFPLIFGKVEIDEFVLVEPNISLVSLENGANNWTFDFAKPPEQQKPGKPGELAASLGDVRITKGRVSYENRADKSIHTLADLELKARLKAMDQPFDLNASGQADQLPFKIDAHVKNPKAMLAGQATEASIKLGSKLLNTDLTGTIGLGDKPAFDLAFKGDVPSLPELADAFKYPDLPARAVLGKVTAEGQAIGSPSDITLKIKDARHESPLLNANFNGDIRIAQAITLALTANAEAPKLGDLAAAMKIAAPAATALGKATATTKVSGQLGDLRFTDVAFKHDSGLLQILFVGSARLAADLTYDGHVEIHAPDLRQLATAAGAKLPDGDVYKSFGLVGDTSGSARNVLLKNATVQFDSIQGQGEAALAFAGKPKLTGSLTTNAIDVTPYATASGAPEEKKTSGGWGKDPIDLTPLRLVDADLSLKTQGIKFQKFDFGPSNLGVTLNGGKLVADLKQTSLFGGAGGAMVTADGSGAVPAVAIKANIDKLSLKPLMTAAAGYDGLEGAGDLNVDIAGKGGDLQALMSSLAGNGAFKFADGTLHGIDLPELANSAKNALQTKSIPLNAFGSNKTTKFNTLNASFAMKDGVAAMQDLKLDAGVMTVSGGGSLDIGGQKLALSLYPELKNKNDGVGGFGVPVKLSGGWNNIGLGVDFDWLLQRQLSGVKTKVQDQIDNELKKQLGDSFGGILGNKNKSFEAKPAEPAAQQVFSQPQTPAPAQAEPEKPVKPKDEAKKQLNKALNGLLGNH